jgi:5,10-methylenetetrahydrofolate reductase
VEYATSQVADLMENGAVGIHLYTMNRVRQIRQIVGDSGLRKLETD